MYNIFVFLFSFIFIISSINCRGYISREPPVHLNSNMDKQIKYKAYGENNIFTNKSNIRTIPEHTIAIGQLKDDENYYYGTNDKEFINKIPEKISLNEEFLINGKNKFKIFCSLCHGIKGMGDGKIADNFFIKPTNLHYDYLQSKKLGYLFDVITNGVRSMPAHKEQIDFYDRWAIASYIKLLQFKENKVNSNINWLPNNLKTKLNNIYKN